MTAEADGVQDRSDSNQPRIPFDPAGGVRTTALLRTVRHADDRRPILNHYIRGTRVGNGQHGEVYLCYDLNHGRRGVAIKAVKRHNPRAEKWSMMRRKNLPTSPHTAVADKLGTTEHKIRKEIAIMKKCRHGHVVRLVEVIDDKLKEKIYMVMEYLGGGEVKWVNSLQQPIQTVDQTRRIIRDVILGLEYLHYQGIIHRDIKPANLLWTADRSKVKISDFGVSHFSYAQRLAAVGQNPELDDQQDPILLDDSDLSKTAGTPSFLAPEVVFDFSSDVTPVNSASNTLSSFDTSPQQAAVSVTRREPITKAIDIWALGVTLYCLLFGKVPFAVKDGNEWALYKLICTQDWSVPDKMGFDQLDTGGRHPRKRDSEGFIVMSLLNDLLQKDSRQRITLNQVKMYPWFTRDLSNPEQWLRETSPNKNDRVIVTESDTSSAMSTLHFKWGWGRRLAGHVSSLLRTVRPRASLPDPSHHPAEKNEERIKNRSTRGSHLSRAKSVGASSRDKSAFGSGSRIGSISRRDKGKRRVDHASAPGLPNGRSKSIERWPMPREHTSPPERIPRKLRRGSESHPVPPRPFQSGSAPQSSNPTIDDRLRNKFTISSIWRWRPRYSPHTTSPVDTPVSSWSADGSGYMPPPLRNGVQSTTLVDPFSRRSEEALLNHRTIQNPALTGSLTAARRASSWGENPTDFMAEVASLNSEELDLDDQAMFLGAGGVCNDLLITSPSTQGLATDQPGPSTSPRQPQPTRNLGGYASPPLLDAPMRVFPRYHNASPLAQVAYDSESSPTVDQVVDDDSDDSDDDDDDLYSSSLEEFGEVLADEEESDEDDEDVIPLEFRRRLPASPPPRSPHSECSDDEPS